MASSAAPQLPLAAVDHEQVRERREAAVVAVVVDAPVPLEAPSDGFGERAEVVLSPAVPDAEAPVLGALGHAVLEDHHRGDGVRVLQIGDVEALDADRQRLEVERFAQLLERLDAARARALCPQHVVAHAQLGVAQRHGDHAALVAALRDAQLDGRPAALAQEARDQIGVGDLGVDAHERRNAHLRVVVVEQEAGQQLVLALPCSVLEVVRAALLDAPPAHREQLHVGDVALDRERDGVIGARPDGDGLALAQVAHRHQPVAGARRLLEEVPLGGFAHALLQVALDLVRPPLEERDHIVDHGAVLLPRDVSHARCSAAADVVIEAGHARAPAGRRALAGAVREDLVERLERRPHLLRRCVRPEVAHAGPVALAREQHARVLVGQRDGDVRIRLVIAQARVERRPVALDQLLLEQQRLARAGHHDRLDRRRAGDELLALAIAVDAREVRRHALAQRGGLAHVEHRAVLRAPDVHARRVGKRPRLIAQVAGWSVDGHACRVREGQVGFATSPRYRLRHARRVSLGRSRIS